MRINKFVALATGTSRRAADVAIASAQVLVNGRPATAGLDVREQDTVTLDGQKLTLPKAHMTIMLNKPVGHVVSRQGQGSKTIYDLLPSEYHSLKPIGRLDKDSSGLLLLTNDGQLANELTHPRHQKVKIYEVELDKPLSSEDKAKIDAGIEIEDYASHIRLSKMVNGKPSMDNRSWLVAMSMGRNRQIRRTFAALGYSVTRLHRTHFGSYAMEDLQVGTYKVI